MPLTPAGRQNRRRENIKSTGGLLSIKFVAGNTKQNFERSKEGNLLS